MTVLTLESLAQRVDVLKQRLAAGVRLGPPSSGLSDLMSDVRRITEELFPGPFSCNDEFDPEYPDDTYVVISECSQPPTREQVRAGISGYVRKMTGMRPVR